MEKSINWVAYLSMAVLYPITFEFESSNWLNSEFALVTSVDSFESAMDVSQKSLLGTMKPDRFYPEPSEDPSPGSPRPRSSIISGN